MWLVWLGVRGLVGVEGSVMVGTSNKNSTYHSRSGRFERGRQQIACLDDDHFAKKTVEGRSFGRLAPFTGLVMAL